MSSYSYEIRQEVIEKFSSGYKRTEISKELGIGYSTVLGWIKRYEQEGETGLQTKYEKCGSKAVVKDWIKAEAIKMREEHEGWGGEYIEMKLKQLHPKEYVPSGRQLRRYFKQAGLLEEQSRLPKGDKNNHWVNKAFTRVQLDAKEQIQTLDGKWSSYLTFTDEYTGAVLEALVFPL